MDWTLPVTLVSCDYVCSMHYTYAHGSNGLRMAQHASVYFVLHVHVFCVCVCVHFLYGVSWSYPKGLALQQLFDTFPSLLNLILCFSHSGKHHTSFFAHSYWLIIFQSGILLQQPIAILEGVCVHFSKLYCTILKEMRYLIFLGRCHYNHWIHFPQTR